MATKSGRPHPRRRLPFPRRRSDASTTERMKTQAVASIGRPTVVLMLQPDSG